MVFLSLQRLSLRTLPFKQFYRVSRIDGFQLINPFQWKRSDQHLNNQSNSLLLTKEMF